MYILHFLTPKANTSFLEYDVTIRQALEKFDYHKYFCQKVPCQFHIKWKNQSKHLCSRKH